MDRDQLRATALGFLGVVVIFGVLAAISDPERTLTRLQTAHLPTVGLVVLVTLGWLFAWGLALRTVLGVLGIKVSPATAFGVFSGAMFANNVTPLGQAGGEPITALLISTVTDTAYEDGFAAIASVDTLNFFPSITLALLGAGYYATITTFSRQLRVATGAIVALAVLVPVGGYVLWRNRRRVRALLTDRLVPLVRWVLARIPGVPVPEPGAVATRIEGFVGSIERIAADRRALALALSASTLGWACQMGGLWLAFRAIGYTVDPAVVLFVVPMGAIAGAAPTPGGSGFIEGTLVVLLSVLLPVERATALAAVVVFRGAVYWVPVAIGAVVVSYVGVSVFDSRPADH